MLFLIASAVVIFAIVASAVVGYKFGEENTITFIADGNKEFLEKVEKARLLLYEMDK